MTRGFNKIGQVTGQHPLIKFNIALSLVLRDGAELFLYRTVDAKVTKVQLTYTHLSFISREIDPMGYEVPTMYVTYTLNGQEVCEPASKIDLQMISQQAQQKSNEIKQAAAARS